MAFLKKNQKRNPFVGALIRAITPRRVLLATADHQSRLPPISDAYTYTGGSYPYVSVPSTQENSASKKKRSSEIFVPKHENLPVYSLSLSSCDENNYIFSPVSEDKGDPFLEEDSSIYDVPLPVENFQTRVENLSGSKNDNKNDVEISGNRAFFKVNRRNAEMMLLRPNVAPGTYLLRPNAKNAEEILILSVRSISSSKEPIIVHIKVNLSNDGHCWAVPDENFPDVDSLLSFYSEILISLSNGKPPVFLSICYPRNFQKVQLSDISIPRSQVKLLDQIGCGNFGEVFRGKWHNLDVAVKCLKKTGRTSQSAILDEAKTMAAVLHENLVKLIAVSVDEEPFLIVTEFMNLGSLLDFMLKGGPFLFSFRILLDILKQIACGMAYLEAEKFLHRDLRAANCLVHQEKTPDGQLDVKIADFGLSAVLDQDNTYESHSDKQVPVRWTAPEALLYKRFSNKSDVWSFGILAFEVFSLGALPYEGKNNFEFWRFVDSGGRISLQDLHSIQKEASYTARILENEQETLCPEEIYSNLMANCWLLEPADRPTFQSLVNFIIDYENDHFID